MGRARCSRAASSPDVVHWCHASKGADEEAHGHSRIAYSLRDLFQPLPPMFRVANARQVCGCGGPAIDRQPRSSSLHLQCTDETTALHSAWPMGRESCVLTLPSSELSHSPRSPSDSVTVVAESCVPCGHLTASRADPAPPSAPPHSLPPPPGAPIAPVWHRSLSAWSKNHQKARNSAWWALFLTVAGDGRGKPPDPPRRHPLRRAGWRALVPPRDRLQCADPTRYVHEPTPPVLACPFHCPLCDADPYVQRDGHTIRRVVVALEPAGEAQGDGRRWQDPCGHMHRSATARPRHGRCAQRTRRRTQRTGKARRVVTRPLPRVGSVAVSPLAQHHVSGSPPPMANATAANGGPAHPPHVPNSKWMPVSGGTRARWQGPGVKLKLCLASVSPPRPRATPDWAHLYAFATCFAHPSETANDPKSARARMSTEER